MDYNLAHREEMSHEMGTMYMALDVATKYVAEWLDKNLKTLDSDYWNRYVMKVLLPTQQDTVKENGAKTVYDLDLPTILSVFLRNKQVLTRESGVDAQLFGYAHSIKDIRNKYFHKNSKPLPQKRVKHDIETVVLFLEGLGASQDIIDEVRADFNLEESEKPENGESRKRMEMTMLPNMKTMESGGTHITSSQEPVAGKLGKPFKPCDSSSLPSDIKSYPKIIQDHLNARKIIGFSVETLSGEEAGHLYDEYKASDFGYDLVNVRLAVRVKQGSDYAVSHSLRGVKSILDRVFVGLIPEFREAIVNSTGDSLGWFFGNNNRQEPTVKLKTVEMVVPPSSITPVIPPWFQHVIPRSDLPYLSVEEVQTTMELSQYDVDRYTQTYVPRSFAEGNLIGRENLPASFRQGIAKTGNFTMLDIGCGTAAFSLGVIHGLDRAIAKEAVHHVNLDLVDGNPLMLGKARDFVSARERSSTYGVASIKAEYVERKILKVADCFQRPFYDMIVTSKFLGEFVCRGRSDIFKEFFKEAVQHICVGGQIVLVEIPKHQKLIEEAIRSLPKNSGKVSHRPIEVRPVFVGTESTDNEVVLFVLVSK